MVFGLLAAIIGGWTLLHAYTPLFFLVIGVFWGSFLIVPLFLSLGMWVWFSGRINARVFLLHFLAPQSLVVVAFLIAIVSENARHPAA